MVTFMENFYTTRKTIQMWTEFVYQYDPEEGLVLSGVDKSLLQ